MLCITSPVFADSSLITDEVSLSVSAGTLSSKISYADKYRITNLKLEGELNMDDIKFLREMAGCYTDGDGFRVDGHLQSLDLSAAQFEYDIDFDVYAPNGDKFTARFADSSACDYLFAYLRNLQKLWLPGNLMSIGNKMFYNDNTLEAVYAPSCVVNIGDNAFYGCGRWLTMFSIPENVTSIGSGAFSNCEGLTSLNIPSGVTSIGYIAFAITGLTTITIPAGITDLGNSAFSGCSDLKSIYSCLMSPDKFGSSKNENQPLFIGVDMDKCVLYVPYGTTDIYRSLYCWKGFKNIVEFDASTLDVRSASVNNDVVEISRHAIDGTRLDAPPEA